MKKIYKKPETNLFVVHMNGSVLVDYSNTKVDGGDDNEYSKGTTGPKIDWETDDEEE